MGQASLGEIDKEFTALNKKRKEAEQVFRQHNEVCFFPFGLLNLTATQNMT